MTGSWFDAAQPQSILVQSNQSDSVLLQPTATVGPGSQDRFVFPVTLPCPAKSFLSTHVATQSRGAYISRQNPVQPPRCPQNFPYPVPPRPCPILTLPAHNHPKILPHEYCSNNSKTSVVAAPLLEWVRWATPPSNPTQGVNNWFEYIGYMKIAIEYIEKNADWICPTWFRPIPNSPHGGGGGHCPYLLHRQREQ